MPAVTIDALVPGADADTVFSRVADFEAYARFTDTIREVRVTAREEGTTDSAWSVNFRNGVLCWSERDHMDSATRRITFEQTEGDFHSFDGEWSVDPVGGDVKVRFTARFDLGMRSLASMVDPIAEQALIDNMHAVLRGLFGDRIVFVADSDAPVAVE